MNIFALVEEEDVQVKRVVVSGDLQNELGRYLQEQKSQFYIDQEKIDFTGSYNVDKGEIFRIRDFSLDESIISALENPLTCDLLDLREPFPKVKAIFAGKWTSSERFICFQCIDSRRVLAKHKFALLFFRDTFTKLKHPGIVLQDHLTALFEGNELLFSSYHNTRQFLDLSEYFKEATNLDLDQFAGHALIQVDNIMLFKENADSIIRKKIALLQTNDVLGSLSTEEISDVAQEYKVDININGGKIVLPENRRQLKKVVSFLNDDYFTAPLTQRRYLTNSKQYLP